MLWNWPDTGVCCFAFFFLHVLVLFVLKMQVAGKRKYTHKTLREKCQALKDLEKGESNKDVAAKYNVPKNTLSSWVKNFQALDDWPQRWKEWNNISFKTVSRESKSVTPEMINAWSKTSLPTPTLLSNYDLKDNYNTDECGLFVSTFQIKLTSWNEKSGRKLSKIRITGMAAANAMGDKLPKFVIAKAKNPRCFKSVKFLPCWYRNQWKSWMDGNLFVEWLRELDRKFLFEGRNVDFVIDNCPFHPHIDNLKVIKFYFLSHNSTSKTQPMDRGTICSL